MKLSLGAGYHHEPGWTTLDVNPATKPDIVGPAYPLDLPTDSVQEMRAVDVLEHVSYRDTDVVLAEWARVLASGGKLYVQVPDALMCIEWFVKGAWPQLADRLPPELARGDVDDALMGLQWRLLGGHADGKVVRAGDDWRFNAHYSLWTRMSLERAVVRAGLEVVSLERNGHPNLLCWTVKP